MTFRSCAPAVTTKLSTLVAVPTGVVTRISPFVAPAGTTAVIKVPVASTAKVGWLVLLNQTAVAPATDPGDRKRDTTGPDRGEKDADLWDGRSALIAGDGEILAAAGGTVPGSDDLSRLAD